MRKCTKKVVHAFINGKRLKTKNMVCDGESIRLHGNLIAWKHNGTIYCTLAGWGTPTTRERLNGLARIVIGHSVFSQKNYVQHYMGTPVSEHDVIRLV